jgi:Spy/CpxP family protein refolding chaperone
MKKTFIGILFTAFIATGAFAQDKQPETAPGPGIAAPHHGPHRFDMAKLNLTDEQKSEMKAINDDFRKQMDELKKNEDITVREWKSKMADIRKTHHDKIQSVLTDEQKATMKTMAHDRKGGFGKGGFGRQGGHGHNIDKLKKDLNLTDDQVAKLKQQHEAADQQLKAVREDKSLTDDQKKAKVKDIRKQQYEDFKSVLTPEQLQKVEIHAKARKEPVKS